jgi:hypothetical protein
MQALITELEGKSTEALSIHLKERNQSGSHQALITELVMRAPSSKVNDSAAAPAGHPGTQPAGEAALDNGHGRANR